MATAAAEVLLQRVFDGSKAMHDKEIQRRPYNRDCKGALRNLQGHACPQHGTLSFPKKQPWTDCSFSIASSKFSSHSSPYCDSLDKNRENSFKALSGRQ